MAQQTKREVTIEEIMAGLDERIELLGTIKAAVRYAFTGQAAESEAYSEPAPAPRPRRKARRVKQTGVKGTTVLAQVLEAAPLTTDEILATMQLRGWETISANPRNIVAVMLGQFARKGKALRHEDGKWSLPMVAQGPADTRYEAA